MALFQQRPQAGDVHALYTLGLQKTLLLVGLGNTGKAYDDTRHNVGFRCVDAFAKYHDFSAWTLKKDLKGMIGQTTINDTHVILLKPTTLMNNSGEAVQATAHFYKIPTGQILTIHDELDIDFGLIRSRIGGSAAGHNGIKSVTQNLGSEDFGRLRVGIGPKKPAAIDSKDFVLQAWSTEEQSALTALEKEATAMLSEYVFSGGQLLPETRNFLL